MRDKYKQSKGLRSAFTLVALVAVIAVLALLMSLTVPALRDLDEQAKIDQCLGNLRQIMRATSMYLSDYEDQFPWGRPTPSGYGVCSWAAGGKTSSDYWQWSGAFIPVEERPLNPYVLGAHVQPDAMNGSQIVERTPMPMFQCPSDRQSHQRFFWMDPSTPPLDMSCYDDVGTSYQYNLHALFDVVWSGHDPYDNTGRYWRDVGHEIVNDALRKHSSTYVMYLEDPMDWGLGYGVAVVGNHGEYLRHSVGFLDGHADYMVIDTRGWCGPGWAAINEEWVPSLGDWRPIMYSEYNYYEMTNPTPKTCEPPMVPR